MEPTTASVKMVGPDDARANLAACLAVYESAKRSTAD